MDTKILKRPIVGAVPCQAGIRAEQATIPLVVARFPAIQPPQFNRRTNEKEKKMQKRGIRIKGDSSHFPTYASVLRADSGASHVELSDYRQPAVMPLRSLDTLLVSQLL